jgi:hypothetical protein
VVSNQIQININAQDAEGIAKVEAFIDNEKVGEDTTAPYQITIDVSEYASKIAQTAKFTDYVLKVVVTDTSGNSSSKEEVINIDNELPSITEVSLLNGQVIGGDTNPITFIVGDNEGLSGVNIYINDELAAEITNDLYEFNINTLDLPDGENILKIEAKDLAENTAINEVNFISDNTGPEITIESIEDGQIVDEVMTLSPELSDEYSSIVSLEFLVGEESQLIVEEGNVFQWELNPYNFPTGSTSIFIKAKDSIGNETISEFPIEILRRLITINIPENFYDPQKARIYVFTSRMDGRLLDSQRIFQETTKIILRTGEDLAENTEIMLTFADYYSGMAGNNSLLTTIQNISLETPNIFNLKVQPRFQGYYTLPLKFPAENFDSDDILSMNINGFGYGGSYFSNSNEVSIDRRRNVTTNSNTDSIYIPLYNLSLNDYSYYVSNWELPEDFVFTPDLFSKTGIERRTINLPNSFDRFHIWIDAFFSDSDFQNNIYHNIYNDGYGQGFSFPDGVPYYFNTIFDKYIYKISMDSYYTERVGEPLTSLQPLDWTINFNMNNKEIEIAKTGNGHTVGKLYLDNNSPQVIDGQNVSYNWGIVFDSQKLDKVIIPEIPEEIKTWGFHSIYENNNMEIFQGEIIKYEGINTYHDYVEKILKNNNRFYQISQAKELIYKSEIPIYYHFTNSILD